MQPTTSRAGRAGSFDSATSASNPMTIGELARRTGLSIKVLREYEGLGLLRSLGRSEGNYRLFDETALWCVDVIGQARALGLTVREIRELNDLHARRPEEPLGPHLARTLDGALARVEARIAELEATRRRILEYRERHGAALTGPARHGPFEPPRHRALSQGETAPRHARSRAP